MWAALRDLTTWLVVLKYAGVCLAAGASIWSTFNELTNKGPRGSRQLTKAGRFAILLILVGLVISLVSEDLQRRQDNETHVAQVAAEAKRTNEIIVSGQQLTSLKLHWQFASRNTELKNKMADGANAARENSYNEQGGVPEVPFDVEDYQVLLLPFLSFVASPSEAFKKEDQPDSDRKESSSSDKTKEGSTVALMVLDAPANAILSFGRVGKDAEWTSGSKGDDTRLISAGFVESKSKRYGSSWPQVTTSPANPKSGISSNYEIDWDL